MYHLDFWKEDRCEDCDEPLFNIIGGKPRPRVMAPFRSLSEQLAVIIPRLEGEIERFSSRPRSPRGEYRSPLDGAVLRDLKTHDGKPFFGPQSIGGSEVEELRIGIQIAFDGCVKYFIS